MGKWSEIMPRSVRGWFFELSKQIFQEHCTSLGEYSGPWGLSSLKSLTGDMLVYTLVPRKPDLAAPSAQEQATCTNHYISEHYVRIFNLDRYRKNTNHSVATFTTFQASACVLLLLFSKRLATPVEYWQFRASEAQPNWEGLHNHNKNLYRSCSTFLHLFARCSYHAGQTWITLVST